MANRCGAFLSDELMDEAREWSPKVSIQTVRKGHTINNYVATVKSENPPPQDILYFLAYRENFGGSVDSCTYNKDTQEWRFNISVYTD